MSFSLNN